MEVVGEEVGVGMEGSTTVGIGASMRHGCVLQSQPLHIVFGRDGGFDPWKEEGGEMVGETRGEEEKEESKGEVLGEVQKEKDGGENVKNNN